MNLGWDVHHELSILHLSVGLLFTGRVSQDVCSRMTFFLNPDRVSTRLSLTPIIFLFKALLSGRYPVYYSSFPFSNDALWTLITKCLARHILGKLLGVCHTPESACLIARSGKNQPATLEIRVRFLGEEDPLEKEMATHSSIFALRIP